MSTRPLATLISVLALVAAGCGGGGDAVGDAVSAGADFAPASAPVYAELNTDVDGEQWQNAGALLDKFPGRDTVVDSLFESLEDDGLSWETDVKPALGDAVYVVWLDLAGGGENIVGFAKPADTAKFNELLECCENSFVHREIDGWTVFAETDELIDQFERARSGGSLADEDAFDAAIADLPEDALARGYVSGSAVQGALRESMQGEGVPPSVAQLGELESLAGGVAVEDDGVRIKGVVTSGEEIEVGSYEAELPATLPAGALVYLSFGGLEDSLKRGLDAVSESVPGFEEQRGQIERALGFSLENDLLPLFENEGALAVYQGTPIPGITFVLEVDDEDKARNVLTRLGALAELSDAGTERKYTLDGVEVTEISIAEAGFSVFHTVSEGNLIVASSEDALSAVLGDGEKLEDDPVFEQAREAAEMPSETIGFVYANLSDGLPYALSFAEAQGDPAPPEVEENIRPLHSVLLYSERDGKRLSFSGFVTIQ